MILNYPMENGKDKNLVGYVRKSHTGNCLKISINRDAFGNCSNYKTSDGVAYIPLKIDLNALEKVLKGERAVTTLFQITE